MDLTDNAIANEGGGPLPMKGVDNYTVRNHTLQISILGRPRCRFSSLAAGVPCNSTPDHGYISGFNDSPYATTCSSSTYATTYACIT